VRGGGGGGGGTGLTPKKKRFRASSHRAVGHRGFPGGLRGCFFLKDNPPGSLRKKVGERQRGFRRGKGGGGGGGGGGNTVRGGPGVGRRNKEGGNSRKSVVGGAEKKAVWKTEKDGPVGVRERWGFWSKRLGVPGVFPGHKAGGKKGKGGRTGGNQKLWVGLFQKI